MEKGSYSENYKLLKPADEDFYNVADFNENADILDRILKELADQNLSLENVVNALATVAKTGDYEDLANKPTTMKANGGNADTVDGKHTSDFLGNTDFVYNWKNGNNTVSLNDFKTEYHAFVFNVLDRPSGCNYGFLDVSKFDGYGFAPATSGVIRQQWTDYDTSTVYSRVFKNNVWTDWLKSNDGGNAATLQGYAYEEISQEIEDKPIVRNVWEGTSTLTLGSSSTNLYHYQSSVTLAGIVNEDNVMVTICPVYDFPPTNQFNYRIDNGVLYIRAKEPNAVSTSIQANYKVIEFY